MARRRTHEEIARRAVRAAADTNAAVEAIAQVEQYRTKPAAVDLSDIQDRAGGNTRPLNPQHINDLMDSIAVLGLITPLTVDQKYRLLAGGHRRAALQRLQAEQPDRFSALFPNGIPVRVMDIDADTDTIDAIQIEIEENTQRRNYTRAEIQEAARKLEAAGYERLRGRPRLGQKSLKRELAAVFKLTEKRIQQLLNEPEKGGNVSTFSLTDRLSHLYDTLGSISSLIEIPAQSEDLVQVQRDIAQLRLSLKRAIAKEGVDETPAA